jgi:hypothetical protein
MPKSKFWRVVLFLILVGLLLSIAEMASAQTAPAKKGAVLCSPVLEGMMIDKYPYAKGAMSAEQIADLGIKAQRLPGPWTGLNWYADPKACGGGSWRKETLPAGEIVWVGPDGYIAYRDSCWNRLAAIPVPPPVIIRTPEPTPPPTPTTPKPYVRSLWLFMKRVLTYPFIGYR